MQTALLQRGLRLEYLILAWNVVGSVIVVVSAVAAHSVALAGFGLDSLIEIFASLIVVWQLKDIQQSQERRTLRLKAMHHAREQRALQLISGVQRLGSQSWDIDLEAARRAGIAVCCWPLRNCMLVAEHVLLQMLAAARRLRELMHITAEAAPWGEPRRSDEDTFAYNWSRRTDVRGLAGSTVGILGFGEIGSELATRLHGFDCAILYHKRRRLPLPAEHALGVIYATQSDLIRHSDFVCSLLPLSDETRQLANADFFAAMKPSSIFVHCGAGGVVDETALVEALRSGRLASAALDTYEWEPLRPDDRLVPLARDPMRNLILTPHVAAGVGESARTRRTSEYTNLLALLAGWSLLHRVV